MRRLFFFALMTVGGLFGRAQEVQDTTWKHLYRASATKVNDLVHTKLEVRFDFEKTWLYGMELVTLRPHFYPTDSLVLDAKQMDISTVALVGGGGARGWHELAPLHYTYDGWQLHIGLGRTYTAKDQYTLYIAYTAKPREAKVEDGERGLYFINPDGRDKRKPTQAWTDDETENTSMWCPTIDKPNQKTTEEQLMTVPDKYVTLSNGRLAGQTKNKDGTRTDDWKMDLPNAPYLFFMGVGDFAIVKDFYKGKEVSYYVEKQYASTARGVFGETPAMIAFFEQVTGVPFPWVKYSQICLRDFTSTAMENTTATAHMAVAQRDARELVDGNPWENNIAHELFHQWFGDYVTCESWSNLTLNESFARYAEYLWDEHRHGADAAGEEHYNQLRNYFGDSANAGKALVRYYYPDQEGVFDDISYGKGSLVLHMLRNTIGDSAFFRGMNRYLITNRLKPAEVAQLRLAMEEVTGEDLHWFFDEWYYGAGHPKVTVDYRYDDKAGTVVVSLVQTQGADRLFRMPLTIDVYAGGARSGYKVWMAHERDTFLFPCTAAPDLVNVDADGYMVWEKTDHKTLDNYIFQYRHGNFGDRREAIRACFHHPEDPRALDILKQGLKDHYAGIRAFTISGLNMKNDTIEWAVEDVLAELAKRDSSSDVRRYAIRFLPLYPGKKYEPLALVALDDPSYTVSGEALNALKAMDTTAALREARQRVSLPLRGTIAEEIVRTLAELGMEEEFDLIADHYTVLDFKPRVARSWGNYLARVKDMEKFKRGVDILVGFRATNAGYRTFIDESILGALLAKKEAAGLREQADYIRSKLPAAKSKS
jgi:aminopeptidase N